MTIASIRATVTNMLDGMRFNREKLAKDCLALCDENERLAAALEREQKKTAELTAQLKRPAGGAAAGSGNDQGFAEAFSEMFGSDLFQQGRKPGR